MAVHLAVCWAGTKDVMWVGQTDASMAAHWAGRSVALTEMLWVGQKDEN